MDKPSTPPHLLFELGRLQVYWYPTEEDIMSSKSPTNVFWQDQVSRNVYGPFLSISEAMNHYTWMASLQKSTTTEKQIEVPIKKDGDVIFVDFVKRRKVIYDLP